jgi:16S rRNA (cytidine1402-2'-O)-methyltransferase
MLSIVAVPIGNLKDITLRAIETLTACDVVVCEDTRVTGMLLKHLEIPKKELISFHGYSDEGKLTHIGNLLTGGKHIVLVSDAGTPGISDPGYAVVSRAAAAGVVIEAIPGPAAFLAALSVSGLPIHRFHYLGFPPLKKGRKTWFAALAEEEDTVVFYESVHRIRKTLTELHDAFASQPQRPVVIARELTKMHAEVIRTTVAELPAVAATVMEKGEFVLILGPK